MHKVFLKYDRDGQCVSVFGNMYMRVSVCVITEGKQEAEDEHALWQ